MVVLNAGMPTTLVPLDVTAQVAFTSADLGRLRHAPSRVVQTLCDAIEVWAPMQRSLCEAFPGFDRDIVALLHDPLTAALVLDPSFATMQRLHLRPAIIDGAFRLLEERGAPEFEVAVAVDAPRFVSFLLDRLLGLG